MFGWLLGHPKGVSGASKCSMIVSIVPYKALKLSCISKVSNQQLLFALDINDCAIFNPIGSFKEVNCHE